MSLELTTDLCRLVIEVSTYRSNDILTTDEECHVFWRQSRFLVARSFSYMSAQQQTGPENTLSTYSMIKGVNSTAAALVERTDDLPCFPFFSQLQAFWRNHAAIWAIVLPSTRISTNSEPLVPFRSADVSVTNSDILTYESVNRLHRCDFEGPEPQSCLVARSDLLSNHYWHRPSRADLIQISQCPGR